MKRNHSIFEAEFEETLEMLRQFQPNPAQAQQQQDEKQIFTQADLERTFSKMIRKATRRAKQ